MFAATVRHGSRPGLLERDAVRLVDAGLLRGLAEDPDVAGGRLVEVGDEPQQRGLAASRRADERHELAVVHGEVDARSSAVTVAPLAPVKIRLDAADDDGLGRAGGGRRLAGVGCRRGGLG